jgi:ABC-type transporter Mla subunit MlaD
MERIWEGLNGFTQFSTLLISVIALLFHIRWSRRSTALGPTILTTLGIFFCFAGIAWGLLDFNPNDVRSSVPHLLQGIRTSFWSSVVGIFWALTLKIRIALFGDAAVPASGAQEGSTVDDLARMLVQLNTSIAGGDDSSLLSQAKLLRGDSNDRIERLTKAFDTYAENIAEANSKALVRALSEVVRDFNAKINEQFGGNFRQLNSGVERLVSWQVQYEKQLEVLIQQETATRESMAEAASRFTDIVNRVSEFAAVIRPLQNVVGALNNQSEQLARAVMVLSGLITEVAEGLPIIEQRIGQMIARSEPGVRPNQETLDAMSRHPAESIRATRAQR